MAGQAKPTILVDTTKSGISRWYAVCAKLLDELAPVIVSPYASLVEFVSDRPGHDQRYAIDAGMIERKLGWKPDETFESGLRKTVQWYFDNLEWCRRVQDGSYQRERLGISA